MKTILYAALTLTLIACVPIIQQETTGCSAFGYDHLTSPAVITTADSCITSILALPLIPSVQLSRALPFHSVYAHYVVIAITSFLLYTLAGYVVVKIKKSPLV